MYVRYKVTLFVLFISLILLIGALAFRALLESIAYMLIIVYTVWGIYHLVILSTGAGIKQNGMGEPDTHNKSDRVELPRVSLIIPVRAEPILARTIESTLLHTDYPIDRKEIIVVTEDEDMARIALYYQYRYPSNVKLLFRRRYFPTKPSALNDAVAMCKGEIIGVVDAEDIVEYDLLKKVVYALEVKGYDAVQTLLMIDNADDSWISKCFAMEYAGWFRLWLNGRARLGLYTPLGGTGNYIKRSALYEVGYWDPTNLAEDAELAIRLMLSGKRIGVVDARQWEEAPVTVKAWIRQRTRWYRGWLQSLWKYAPILLNIRTIKRIGLVNTIAALCMLVAPLVVALVPVSYALTALWLLEHYGVLGTTLTSNLFPSYAIVPLVFNPIYYLTWIYASKLEGIRFISNDLIFIFIYMNIMMPIAAYRALYQCIFKDVFWEKTMHEGRGVRWHAVNTAHN